ncbi:Arc family DNA-binding protein [Pseudomonas sp. PA-7-1E]|uniref:Arc family DNA-binding protein n=1 Tax=Gammaproteobacteria TaxID=1236 RepID=UPI001934100B|nr:MULTISPECIES: Arc family DNA-binding protein [Gammaproteobacteria]MBM0557863.1 Arc family DNA-binding protein [Escherichia coli]MCF4988340.1 Arc family DNA-binding protein [Pseudomonas gessardii]MCF5043295.1 Arc family DNA-binding protein [Pseudomonas sp. PA-7-1E]MCF5131274.1 Arc family DNA-binding protein [Pseudomonas sp. PA-6-4F]
MSRLNLQQTSHSQLNYRMPANLKARLIATARDNKRSLTSEITERLERSFAEQDAAAILAENNAMLKALCAHHGVPLQ